MTWENFGTFLRVLFAPGLVGRPGDQRARGRAMHSRGLPLFFLHIVLLLQTAIAGTSETDVTVLDVTGTDDPLLNVTATAYRHGFLAALWSKNHTSRGTRVAVAQENVNTGNIASKINDAASKHSNLIAVFGPVSSSLLNNSLASLSAQTLVAFGPLGDALYVREWTPSFYFFVGDVRDFIYALLKHAVVHLRVKRVGFMSLDCVSSGAWEFVIADLFLEQVERNFSAVFQLDVQGSLSPDDAKNKEKWERFVSARPQAILVVGAPSETTRSFLKLLFKDNRTNAAHVLVPMMLQALVLDVWKGAVASGTRFVSRQVFAAGSNPLASDTSYTCIKRFQSEMSDYLKNSKQTAYTNHRHYLSDDTSGEMMVAGWMAGDILMQTLSTYDSTRDRKLYRKSLFGQRRYFVDDFIFGDYGDDIGEKAEAQGAISKCNHGGNVIFIKTFEEGFRAVDVKEGRQMTGFAMCSRQYALYDPVFALVLDYDDIVGGIYVPYEIITGSDAAVDWKADHLYVLKVLDSRTADAVGDLRREKEEFMADVVLGFVTEEMVELPDLAFIDPIFLTSHLNSFSRNTLYFTPTMEQHLFVMAQYLSTTDDPSAHAVVHFHPAEDVLDVARRTFDTFQVTLKSAVDVDANTSLEKHLPTSGLTLLIEVQASDIEVLAKHLEENKDSRLAIHFLPFAVYFPQLQKHFGGKEIAERLLFTTNLPHWDDIDSELQILIDFHDDLHEDDWSPMSLNGFIVSRVLQTVVQSIDIINASSIVDYFYSKVLVKLGGMVYGPFLQEGDVACTGETNTKNAACAKNYGASSIAVWSLARAFNYTVPPLSEGVTPSMLYRVPDAQGLTRAQLIGIIVGTVLGAALLAGLLTLLLCCCRDSRDNRNAPKERTDPVTLVFTDIESSTALWAACPQVMPDAVATHHQLIRSLIAQHRCYEVKTIGDSFMIACRSAFAAVQLARDLQRVFVSHDWGTTEIDDAYRGFEERRIAEDDQYVPPTARLGADVYRQYWNGLRVRAGVHTGLCDIRHDEVTKGYDYYGDTSNTAARTESIANGGQVLLTRAAYMALSTAEREQVDVTALGAVALRGVPRPVGMYQLDAVPGRTFAALRLEETVNFDEGTGSDAHSLMSSGSNPNSMNINENPFALLLTDIFAPLSPPQRWKMLESLCERWGVPVSGKGSKNTTELCNTAVCRLATKLAHVNARRIELRENRSVSGFGIRSEGSSTNPIMLYSVGSFTFDTTAPVELRSHASTTREIVISVNTGSITSTDH